MPSFNAFLVTGWLVQAKTLNSYPSCILPSTPVWGDPPDLGCHRVTGLLLNGRWLLGSTLVSLLHNSGCHPGQLQHGLAIHLNSHPLSSYLSHPSLKSPVFCPCLPICLGFLIVPKSAQGGIKSHFAHYSLTTPISSYALCFVICWAHVAFMCPGTWFLAFS